jgi:hypothetical protein
VVSAVTLVLGGRYLERVWGTTEFLKVRGDCPRNHAFPISALQFCAVNIVVPNIMAVGLSFIESFVLRGHGEFL